MTKPSDFTQYLADYPKEIQERLELMRAAIKEAAPEAEEVISYGMPALKQNGILVWYGAHTGHIGLYPRASGIAAFKEELSGYKSAKGSVQFPLDEPLPLELIRRIVKFRLAENSQKAKAKK